LFDAAAAIMGLRNEVLYEGQAAMELETQAVRFGGHGRAGIAVNGAGTRPYPITFPRVGGPVDVRPLIRALVRDLERGRAIPEIAFCFHVSVAELMLEGCLAARRQTSLRRVVLGGGVFQNRLLLELLVPRLRSCGFDVLTSRLVPPNDGGISLGQAAIAAARLAA
jgi:hydrogenase maturation protein HypF